MQIQKLPYYIFMIVRPDGNAAYSKINEQYPLDITINELITIGSNLYNLNLMQMQIIHPDIKNNRKEEIDLAKNSSIKCMNTTTYQIRFLDTVNGYMFLLVASNNIDAKRLDSKLEELYKTFVNYVVKAPFFNVIVIQKRVLQRSRARFLLRKVTKSYICDEIVKIKAVFCQ